MEKKKTNGKRGGQPGNRNAVTVKVYPVAVAKQSRNVSRRRKNAVTSPEDYRAFHVVGSQHIRRADSYLVLRGRNGSEICFSKSNTKSSRR